MNIQELHIELEDRKISTNRYYLHGLYGSSNQEGKLSLVIRRGKFTIEYDVFYVERGEEHSKRTFYDENSACEYFLHKIQEE